MAKKRPLIGITPGFDYKTNKLFLNKGYTDAINQAGGIAFVLPIITDEDILKNALKKCDGFLLSGGPDIDAVYFGEANMPYGREISPFRDAMEILVAQRAIALNKPILGICRGTQVINIAFGGNIYQDIVEENKDNRIIKHLQEAPVWYPVHNIVIEKESKLASLFDKSSIKVNSFHHQAIKNVASGFRITSMALDGIIESIEHKAHIFAVGVQWHPELMWQEDRMHLKLFEELVKCA